MPPGELFQLWVPPGGGGGGGKKGKGGGGGLDNNEIRTLPRTPPLKEFFFRKKIERKKT